jgi:hypothetical protein
MAGQAGMAREPILRGPDDAAAGARRQRPAGVVDGSALLNLDECETLPFSATRSISPTGVL